MLIVFILVLCASVNWVLPAGFPNPDDAGNQHPCQDFDTGYYEDNHRYDIAPTEGLNWNEGRSYCLSRGGDLAYHGMDSLDTRE